MTTIHDVFRFLVRGGPNTESNIHRLLLTIDSHEKGYANLEDYEAELAAQAEALRTAPPTPEPVSAEARAAEAEARIARLEALLAAQTGTVARPAPPAPETPTA